MDIQKLQALAVIQEAGSFSRAAETLGYSQAGLTYMMNSLRSACVCWTAATAASASARRARPSCPRSTGCCRSTMP